MRMAAEIAQKMGFRRTYSGPGNCVAEACINALEHGNQFDVSTKIYITMTVHAIAWQLM